MKPNLLKRIICFFAGHQIGPCEDERLTSLTIYKLIRCKRCQQWSVDRDYFGFPVVKPVGRTAEREGG